MDISSQTRMVSGILLLSVPSIQYGGTFLLRLLSDRDPSYIENPVRQGLFRAGHAHAGVLVMLSLICQLLADAVSGPWWCMSVARFGTPLAAILIPLGFFLSVASPKVAKPGRWIIASWFGVICLALSVLTLGVLLIRSA